MMDKINELLQKTITVINIGVHQFADSLEQQGVDVVQIDWVPPAGGDREMVDLLDKIL
jgi:hypothetical protein